MKYPTSIYVFIVLCLWWSSVDRVMAVEDNTCDKEGVCLEEKSATPASSTQQQANQAHPTHGSSKAKVAKGANAQGAPPEVITGTCKDRYEVCPQYQRHGECEKNPGWMIVNCPHSCNACHLLDPKLRCDRNFLNISHIPAYEGTGMKDMFENLPRDFPQFEVEYLSRDPYVVFFHNFVSDDEITALLYTVEDNWERSTDTGKMNEFGETGRVLSQSRTSSNAWCRSKCENHPLVRNVMDRIAAVTHIPIDNYESFQILRYEEGQYYRAHHDMGP